MARIFQWQIGRRRLELGRRTLVMGVVNVTPDSFADGGRYFTPEAAIAQGERLLEEGADILDIGGESTRPGARVQDSGVTAEEELRRVLPVIEGLCHRHPEAVLSVDTYKAEVARRAVGAGAEVVNDISGLRWDPAMPAALAELNCGTVVMHMRGRPEQWRRLPAPDDVVKLVKNELRKWTAEALAAGIARERLVLDPGIGFGKNFEQNYPLLDRFEELHRLGFPLLAGTSRKSFIGRALAKNGNDLPPEGRLYGSLATVVLMVLSGAHIVRVHDVRPTVDVVRMTEAVMRSRE